MKISCPYDSEYTLGIWAHDNFLTTKKQIYTDEKNILIIRLINGRQYGIFRAGQ